MDLVSVNHDQVTRMTPEPALASENVRARAVGGRLTYDVTFSVRQVHIHGGSSVDSGSDPETLLPQSRYFTTSPPRVSEQHS
ncbi:hypothetical protein AVEN_153063-1 [Araneus ventricosus]|uniref:Uncharacterized protein n=1 Tax=Araneus ventricosus TaxID=182803 RepID=A0A4Y2W3X3_ARAVE|nr:hypothetical protein AVEN_153063-1 [Araneus ventricosus]